MNFVGSVVVKLPVRHSAAIDRSSDDEFNKGIEAAVAALEMIVGGVE